MFSAILMFRRLFDAIKYAAREEGFMALFGAAIFLIVMGTITYATSQHWNVADAFYFSVCTLTTSSVADPHLVLDGRWIKVFTSFYTVLGIGILVETVRQIGFGYVHLRTDLHNAKLARKSDDETTSGSSPAQ